MSMRGVRHDHKGANLRKGSDGNSQVCHHLLLHHTETSPAARTNLYRSSLSRYFFDNSECCSNPITAMDRKMLAALWVYAGWSDHTFSGNTCSLCGYTKSCSHSFIKTYYLPFFPKFPGYAEHNRHLNLLLTAFRLLLDYCCQCP